MKARWGSKKSLFEAVIEDLKAGPRYSTKNKDFKVPYRTTCMLALSVSELPEPTVPPLLNPSNDLLPPCVR